MSQGRRWNASIATDPRATAGTSPDDQLPADGKGLLSEVLTFSEVSAAPSYDPLYDVSVNLQSLIGLPPDFCEALESLGGCSLSLATKLMSSHETSGSGEFVAGQL